MALIGYGRFDWSSWIYGMIAGFISGGAGAVVSGVTVSMMDPNDFNFYTKKFYLLVLTVFLANGVMAMMAFLHQNPLPKMTTTTTTTIQTTEQNPSPPQKVVTTVEKVETKVEPVTKDEP